MTKPVPRFISLEGGEGAGKSTLIRGLSDFFAGRGLPLLQTREPGGTALGDGLRALLLDPSQPPIHAEAELLMMFASRAQLVRDVIRPALAAGQWVLCDRYVDASFAYQGAGRGQPEARIEALREWVCGSTMPTLTLLLDVPVSLGRQRAAGRGPADRIEAEGDGFFERVRQIYRQRAADDPQRFRILDASAPPQEVLAQALAAIEPLLTAVRA
ncbi:dTMP kinase [Frateuria aurantia]